MAINATTAEQITINPTNVRYSINVDKLNGNTKGFLRLQRSEKREDGTWIDDPHPDSKKSIALPTDTATQTAWAGIEALLPSILAKLNITITFTGYRLQLLGKLSTAGVLDVIIVMQLLAANGWKSAVIPSLNAFLSANTDLYFSVVSAWDALDTAINTANITERWL